MTLEEYYDEVSRLVKETGYEIKLDRETVEFDKEMGLTPQESAAAFIKDWS